MKQDMELYSEVAIQPKQSQIFIPPFIFAVAGILVGSILSDKEDKKLKENFKECWPEMKVDKDALTQILSSYTK